MSNGNDIELIGEISDMENTIIKIGCVQVNPKTGLKIINKNSFFLSLKR